MYKRRRYFRQPTSLLEKASHNANGTAKSQARYVAVIPYLGRHRSTILRRRRIYIVSDTERVCGEIQVADDGGLCPPLEPLRFYSRYQSCSTDHLDRAQARWHLGHCLLAGRHA